MREEVVAKRYAGAVFEIALERGELDEVQGGLDVFSKAMGQLRLLASSLANKEIHREKRRDLIVKICASLGCPPLVRDVLLVMMDKERIPLFPQVAEIHGELVTRARELTFAEAAVADASQAEDVCRQIVSLLEEKLKRPARCESRVDPELIGGVVVKLGNAILDASVKGRLHDLKQAMLR